LTAVDSYHSSTARHCMAVAGFASVWARMLGVKDKDMHLFTRGALLHDIGKMRIPLKILDKSRATDAGRGKDHAHPPGGEQTHP
jgi:putative nucleotidyltransferase with HDIG domain